MPYKDPEARNAYAREWYAKNKETHGRLVRQNEARRRKIITEYLYELKLHPCLDCGGEFDPVAMDFDHVSGRKLFNVSEAMRWGYSLDKVKEEVAKCELVCSNCHRLRTKVRRQATE